jgi:FeS assembly SUF system protein
MMRLLGSFFGRKSIGKEAMKEAKAPDPTKAADPTRPAAEGPTIVDSTLNSNIHSSQVSITEAQPAVVPEAATPSVSSTEQSPTDQLKDLIIEQLKTVFDPEIPINIYEMGLIYDVDVDLDGATRIRMTLTTPMCPAAEELPPEVEGKARSVEGVTSVQLDLVWEPPWTPNMMSEAARLELGMI